ncbi:MAG TPA: tetratricopeptide repeat protein, partial [Candidatus Bathyarchaeia archaeon]|nr:tetratricopeptide repeat protein [Candidatus Bathyarchaeia archaeon]
MNDRCARCGGQVIPATRFCPWCGSSLEDEYHLADLESPKSSDMSALSARECANKGVTLSRLGRYDEAIACYDKALELDPRLVSAWTGKGVSLYHLGHYEEAIACYDKALELDPRYTKAWGNKGVSLRHLGRSVEALQCYDTA